MLKCCQHSQSCRFAIKCTVEWLKTLKKVSLERKNPIDEWKLLIPSVRILRGKKWQDVNPKSDLSSEIVVGVAGDIKKIVKSRPLKSHSLHISLRHICV